MIFSGCVASDDKFAKNEKFKVFKVFLSYQSGYYYKVLYYVDDNKIDSVNIYENDLEIYSSNKSLLIYTGKNKWRLYINESNNVEGIHSGYMSGKISTETDVTEIPLEEP